MLPPLPDTAPHKAVDMVKKLFDMTTCRYESLEVKVDEVSEGQFQCL